MLDFNDAFPKKVDDDRAENAEGDFLTRRREMIDDFFENRCLFVLTESGHEYLADGEKGRLLKPGTVVVASPENRDVFVSYDADSKKVFVESDCTWRTEDRTKIWFPPIKEEFVSKTNEIMILKEAFFNGIETNLRDSVGTVFPGEKRRGLFSSNKISKIETVADLSERAIDRLLRTNGVPLDALQTPDNWRKELMKTVGARVYEVFSGTDFCRVFVYFAYPIIFGAREEPFLSNPTSETLRDGEETYDEWRENQKKSGVALFATFGSYSTSIFSARKGFPFIFSASCDDAIGGWKSDFPELVDYEPGVRKFALRLTPTTLGDKLRAVRERIEFISKTHLGNVLLNFVAKDVGLSECEVQELFGQLEKTNEYEIYKANNSTAIRKRG